GTKRVFRNHDLHGHRRLELQPVVGAAERRLRKLLPQFDDPGFLLGHGIALLPRGWVDERLWSGRSPGNAIPIGSLTGRLDPKSSASAANPRAFPQPPGAATPALIFGGVRGPIRHP